MGTSSPLIFKKPTATEVVVGVQFMNNLGVTDSRATFHNLIKREFPAVIMPEQNKLAYDFGEYSLYTENLADRLEIAMNYFRLRTTSYPGFTRFRSLFLNSLSIFARCYNLTSFSQLALQYFNDLPLESGQGFEDCFTIDVVVPENLQTTFYAGKGVLVFQESEGHVAVDLDPQLQGTDLTGYKLNLTFGTQTELAFGEEKDDVTKALDDGHRHLSRFFFSILKKEYIEYLRTL